MNLTPAVDNPPDEKSLPRLHLAGTLALVISLTLALGGYFTYQAMADNEASLQRLEADLTWQQETRLKTEMNSGLDYLEFVRSRTEDVLRQALHEQVDSTLQVMEGIYQREKGRRPEAEVKKLIVEALRPMRFFEGRGYIFIDDLKGLCILLPIAPQREGSSLYDNKDDTGHYIMRGLIEAATNPKTKGESRYRWYSPDNPKAMSDKLAYVRLFEPYGWIVGTGDYLEKWEQRLQKEAIERMRGLRFGRTGYFTIHDRHSRILLSPALPTLEGKLVADQPPNLRPIGEQIQEKGRQGGGFLTYDLPTSEPGKSQRKRVYVAQAPAWGWTLTTGLLDDEMQEAIGQERRNLAAGHSAYLMRLAVVVLAALAVATLMSIFFSRWLRRLFLRYHQAIESRNQALLEKTREVELAAKVFESGSEATLITDADERIIAVNHAFTQITGYSADEVIGQTPRLLTSGRHDKTFYRELWTTLQASGQWSGELWNRRKDGSIFPQWTSIVAVRDGDGPVSHYIGTFIDISERKQVEEHIRRLAEYDALTQLPNRHLMQERLEREIASAQRSGAGLALLFLDLDRFKNINDSLGHTVGDEVLQQVARRLAENVRVVDTVCRLGGDEFVLLLPHLDHPEQAMQVAQKLHDVLDQAFHVRDYDLTVTPSIGIALYPRDGEDSDTLLKNADSAMYRAKSLGRNNCQFYTEDLNTAVSERLALENDLRRALGRDELLPYFQPVIDLSDGRIVACEALLRWQSPDRGLVMPDQFIPLAEETGLIVPMGANVLGQACRQLRAWDRAGLPPLRMAVNVSVVQLRHSQFPATLRAVLKECGLAPQRIELEMTESVLANESELTHTLDELSKVGVGLALDDFGTGYSSLSYLKRLRFDTLKIDRSFISDLPADADDATITRTILSIARDFGMATVAEGVETQEQFDFLRQGGGTYAQGYLFSRPLPAAEFEALWRRSLEG